jgi:hypothetical protein
VPLAPIAGLASLFTLKLVICCLSMLMSHWSLGDQVHRYLGSAVTNFGNHVHRYFGSAVTNFGIELFLRSFTDLAARPGLCDREGYWW